MLLQMDIDYVGLYLIHVPQVRSRAIRKDRFQTFHS